jgi:hypothetical protein
MTIATDTAGASQLAQLVSDDEMRRLIREVCALDAPPSSQAARLGDKGTFPKLLALDMNAWIYLSRAHYGRAERPSHVAALESISRATAASGVVAPVFPMNLTEVTDTSAGDRRARLAAFMVSLSGNHSIVYSGTIRDREIHDAIQRCYLGRAQRSDIRTRVLHWGVAAAVGIGGIEISTASGNGVPAALQLVLDEVSRHPRISELSLASVFSKEDTAHCRELDKKAAEAMAQTRDGCVNLTWDERLAAETWNLLQRGTVRDAIDRMLEFNGLPPDPFFNQLVEAKRRREFFNAIPQLHVQSVLTLTRDRNRDASPDRNDLKDLFFLGVALPYAEFVVTEKAWGHISRASKLSEHYGTQVVSLEDLPQVLEANGCYDPTSPNVGQGSP